MQQFCQLAHASYVLCCTSQRCDCENVHLPHGEPELAHAVPPPHHNGEMRQPGPLSREATHGCCRRAARAVKAVHTRRPRARGSCNRDPATRFGDVPSGRPKLPSCSKYATADRLWDTAPRNTTAPLRPGAPNARSRPAGVKSSLRTLGSPGIGGASAPELATPQADAIVLRSASEQQRGRLMPQEREPVGYRPPAHQLPHQAAARRCLQLPAPRCPLTLQRRQASPSWRPPPPAAAAGRSRYTRT